MKGEKLSEKVKGIIILIAVIIFSFIIGAAGAGLAAYRIYGGRSSGDVDQLIARYNQLARDYEERQSVIDEQQRIIRNEVTECIGYVERAGEIITRADSNTSRAISNLTEAIRFIRQGIEERETLKNQLDNIYSGLYRIRDTGGEDTF
jgi:hypothetical protein